MNIQRNKSLKDYNTFMIDVTSKEFVEVNSNKDILDLFNNDIFEKDFLILSGGSNILFTKDYDGIVIHPNILGKTVVKDDEKYIFIEVSTGEKWEEFVKWSVDNNYLGLQNLANIPGNCGATPVQNVGAYGVEVKDVIEYVEYFDLESGKFKTLQNSECNFRYRDSIFKHELKGKALITKVCFKLQKWSKDDPIPEEFLQYGGIINQLDAKYKKPYTIEKVFNAVNDIRNEKLPQVGEYGSCGSTFANPIVNVEKFKELQERYPDLPNYPTDDNNLVKIPAAYLLEQLGWKNKRVGNCGTWIKHPLIVTNYGGASGKEIYTFIKSIQEDFKKNTGIELETEINIIF
jgi:UDP-N-acetylmuramate dehydrogenase